MQHRPGLPQKRESEPRTEGKREKGKKPVRGWCNLQTMGGWERSEAERTNKVDEKINEKGLLLRMG